MSLPEITLEGFAVPIGLHPLAFLQSVHKEAFVSRSVGKDQFSIAIGLIITPFAVIDIAVAPFVHAISATDAIHPISVVSRSGRPDKDTLAVGQPILKITRVRIAVCIIESAPSGTYAMQV